MYKDNDAGGWTAFSYLHGNGNRFQEVTSIDLTIGSSGMATLSSIFDLDFNSNKIWQQVLPYAVSSYDQVNQKVVLERAIYLYVPAGKGVIVVGSPGTYQIPVQHNSTFNTLDTMLKGVSSNTPLRKVSGEYTNYVLGKKNEQLGFYAVADGTILAEGKAYLPLPTAGLPNYAPSRGISIIFGDGTTDINQNVQSIQSENDVIYNLQGQKLAQPQKGINIINGKKVVIN